MGNSRFDDGGNQNQGLPQRGGGNRQWNDRRDDYQNKRRRY